MARTVRDSRLESRSARLKLPPRHEPYWRTVDAGMHLGYRKGRRKAAWIARQWIDGRYRKKVLGLPDDIQDAEGTSILSFGQAQGKARAWFREQLRGGERSGPYTISVCLDDYLEAYQARGGKALRNIRYRIDAFIRPKLGNVEVEALTTRQLRSWHNERGNSPARLRSPRGAPQKTVALTDDPEQRRKRRHTANKVLTTLKAALNHAYNEGGHFACTDEQWRKVKPFAKVDVPRVRYLNLDESRRLVNASAPDFRMLVQAALLTGARYGELISLLVGDFKPDSETVHVRFSKSGHPRHIPLNGEGVAFFERAAAGRIADERMFLREDGEPWGPSHQHRRLLDAAKAAKITDVSFHILRHSYGSALAMRGVPMGVIAKVLGHEDTRTTEKHYAALAPSYVHDTIRRELPELGIVSADGVVPLKQAS